MKNAAEGNAAKSYCCFTANAYTLMRIGGSVTLPGARDSELSAMVAGGPAKALGPNSIEALDYPGGAVNCQNLAPDTGGKTESVGGALTHRFCFSRRFLRDGFIPSRLVN